MKGQMIVYSVLLLCLITAAFACDDPVFSLHSEEGRVIDQTSIKQVDTERSKLLSDRGCRTCHCNDVLCPEHDGLEVSQLSPTEKQEVKRGTSEQPWDIMAGIFAPAGLPSEQPVRLGVKHLYALMTDRNYYLLTP